MKKLKLMFSALLVSLLLFSCIDSNETETEADFKSMVLGSSFQGGILIHVYDDNKSGLIVSNETLGAGNFEAAQSACADYKSGGYDDWELPYLSDLKIIQSKKNLLSSYEHNWYWSSASNREGEAFHVGFDRGDIMQVSKAHSKFYIATRYFTVDYLIKAEKYSPDTKSNESESAASNEVIDPSNEVAIGNQVWMTQNLNVDKFRNGEPIPHAKTSREFVKAGRNKQPAWCYYNHDIAKGEIYGKLYNWYAVNDPRGLAPDGFHVPSAPEWRELKDFLGRTWMGDMVRGCDGCNSSGFSGLTGGRYKSGFDRAGAAGYFWTSTSNSSIFGRSRIIFRPGTLNWMGDYSYTEKKIYGLSVRCLRD